MFPRIPDDKTNFTGLWEEYKLLQDKVDKIGAFRFQVKGWLIPLVSAWLVAVYTAKIPPQAYLIAAVFPLLFWLLERNHHEHQAAFVRRIFAIEEALQSEHSPYFGPRPKVKKEDRTKLLLIPPISPGQAISLSNSSLGRKFPARLILRAHGIFYWTVAFSVILVTALSLWLPPVPATGEPKTTLAERATACTGPVTPPTAQQPPTQHSLTAAPVLPDGLTPASAPPPFVVAPVKPLPTPAVVTPEPKKQTTTLPAGLKNHADNPRTQQKKGP